MCRDQRRSVMLRCASMQGGAPGKSLPGKADDRPIPDEGQPRHLAVGQPSEHLCLFQRDAELDQHFDFAGCDVFRGQAGEVEISTIQLCVTKRIVNARFLLSRGFKDLGPSRRAGSELVQPEVTT